MIINKALSQRTCQIIFFTIITFIVDTAFAEYYMVTPYTEVGNAPFMCTPAVPCKTSHYYKKYKKQQRKHFKNARGNIVTYYVWQTCGGALWVPKCGGCMSWGPPPTCRTPTCQDFYIPPNYYERQDDSYYYDPDMDWDMRTTDDF